MKDVRKIISTYDRFVPHQLLDLLGRKDIYDIKLGDQVERKITVLFSDIRDFTTLSESMTPQENFNFINSYLSQMNPLITVNNGIIDKYIGDAVMAIFPDSADDAVRCGLQMIKILESYNEGRQRAGYRPIRIGIGLNTGLAMIGAVGSYNRMDSTVISDAVNLSSRLESQTKNYQVDFVISEYTCKELSAELQKQTRFIDRIQVKGKIQPVNIYEVFAGDPEAVRERKFRNKDLFEQALACYHYKNTAEAEKLLLRILKECPEDKPAAVYLERCREFKEKGMHSGSYELTRKLKWSSDFLVHNDTIDSQHKDLVVHSQKLLQCLIDKCDPAVLESEMDRFREEAIIHFESEEAILKKVEYPFLENQQEQHRKFIASLAVLKEEVLNPHYSRIFRLFKMQVFLVDWLVNHTLKEDRHFSRYLIDDVEE